MNIGDLVKVIEIKEKCNASYYKYIPIGETGRVREIDGDGYIGVEFKNRRGQSIWFRKDELNKI